MQRFIWFLLILALVNKAVAQSAVSAWKVALTTQVLQRVGAAYGFDVLELPKLVIYPRQEKNNRIAHLEMISAWLNQPDKSLYRSRLIMDEELIDVCLSLDKQQKSPAGSGSALAFVLSHELAHFYHRHATFRSFAEQKRGTITERVASHQERQADQTGLLFAYLAGYDPDPVLTPLFDELYKTYNLNDKLWGYPTKSERQRETKLRTDEFQTYGYLLGVGNALYCQKYYAEAARCFEYVFTRYPLKEAYNNFGVCRLQQVIRGRKKDPISFYALPFEIDPRNRLLRLGERSGTESTVDVSVLLKDASVAFTRATELDAGYKTAYLNQALSSLLSNNAFLALGELIRLVQKTAQPLPPNGYLIQAMAYGAVGDWINADQAMRTAVRQRGHQASYNRRILQAIKTGSLTTLQQPWQRLDATPSPLSTPGCRLDRTIMLEVDAVPKDISWRGTFLMELSSPPPFISVESDKAGGVTYFRVKLQKAVLYFRWPDGSLPAKAGNKKSA